MKTQILTILFLLGLSFGTANATSPCSEIHVVPVQNTLKSCGDAQSETVEIVIHNPEYCTSTITDITLSDTANFELNTSFGAVPCDSEIFSMRGYQFCTVGVTFKPVTTSGTFETDINVGTADTPIITATIGGEIVDTTISTCSCAKKYKHRHGKHGKNCNSDKHGKHGKSYDNDKHGKHGKNCNSDKHGKHGKSYDNDKHGKHGKSCNNDKHGKHGKHGKSCNNDKHSKHGKSCDNDKHSKHGKSCDNDKHGKSCEVKHNDSCTTCVTPKVETLYSADTTNYLAGLNLLNPMLFASQITIVNDEVVFDNYNENTTGLAIFQLDKDIDFTSMLTFTANVDSGLFMPIMSGDTGTYMTTDVRNTKQYGFIFPSTIPLSNLNFTTWNLSFTGSINNLSIVEVTNENILEKDQ